MCYDEEHRPGCPGYVRRARDVVVLVGDQAGFSHLLIPFPDCFRRTRVTLRLMLNRLHNLHLAAVYG